MRKLEFAPVIDKYWASSSDPHRATPFAVFLLLLTPWSQGTQAADKRTVQTKLDLQHFGP
jgi:hypothetical protein